MKKTKTINFKLLRITNEQFAVLDEPPQDEKKINVLTSSRFGFEGTRPIIGVFVQVKFESSEKPILLIETGCHFQIEDSDWESLKNNEDKSVIIPKGLATHLIMITLGTLRGILHTKTENTPFNKFLIPLIDVTKLIQEDIVFSYQDVDQKSSQEIMNK